jgi:hypothetical protein
MTLTVPVAYIIFNRPRHTRETFAAIRRQKPSTLYIIADGPRPGHPTDVDNCREVRDIVEMVDWPCKVYRDYADENLGCKLRVITGLDWVFSSAEEAIILEDDCLPHPDFFDYCDNLLDHYKDDERVYVVTGNNYQDGLRWGDASYYFSKYPHIWGWATWRRAWQKNCEKILFWPAWRSSAEWYQHTPNPMERRYWSCLFDRMHREETDIWDYSWTSSVWYHGGLTATPNVNLVTNIGIGPEGTHTLAKEDQDGLPVQPLGPLSHPGKVEQNRVADSYVFENLFGGKNRRLHMRLLNILLRFKQKLF